MKYIQASAGLSYRIDFTVDNDLVVPDTDSVQFSWKDNAQTELWDNDTTPVVVPADRTGVTLEISGDYNTKTRDYEVRYATTSFTYGGVPYTLSDSFCIVDNVLFPLTTNDVRGVLGLTDSEVPDSQIDILAAYEQLKLEVGEAFDLQAILDAGTVKARHIVTAVKLKSAMALGALVQTSLFQMEQTDNTLYKRFAKIDFQTILGEISNQYASTVALITEEVTGEVVLAIISAGTDPITNT